ncbi:hypothetical protein DFH08DRAFT_955467 [Mycena albidolilacea]|uniref:Uncharacterized protein n=1 Tax=Mycena albidolilacea TaxID=1033008 RepID=A0AAD7AB37_9AGAR|nr:hypothetical protein DFH08DRAFT_955467 [Mycena albidolilacea]
MLNWGPSECLTQLEQFCDGGERAVDECVCGTCHCEYFEFTAVGGFASAALGWLCLVTWARLCRDRVVPLLHEAATGSAAELRLAKTKPSHILHKPQPKSEIYS